MSTVSVVITVRNSVRFLRLCLESIRANKSYEIIVVDGKSTDGSLELAEELADKVLSDDGRGITYAAMMGLNAATGEYVLFVGPDNILPVSFIEDLVDYAKKYKYSGVAAQTRMIGIQTGWDKLLDKWWQFMCGSPGQRNVIGTPCLYERKVLLAQRFDESPWTAGDTELCQRLLADGCVLGMSSVAVYDIGNRSWKEIKEKFILYGKCDAKYFATFSPNWTLKRKIQSLMHPLVQTKSGIIWTIESRCFLTVSWFFVLTAVMRYFGWLKNAMMFEANSNH